tara:strand:- start:2446 stop:2718 length:273 start_codon:yes stop_codon:yes gene_type:complete
MIKKGTVMRKAKLIKKEKKKLNDKLAAEGRTKNQRRKKKMKAAVDTYDGRLGALKGETLREKYLHMHRLIGDENTRLKKEAEEKESKKTE